MDHLTIFLKGLAAGLVLCAPVGPVGIFSARRIFTDGRMAGFFALLGGSAVDAIYCTAAGFGTTFVSVFLQEQRFLLERLGGLVLMGVGLKVFLTPVIQEERAMPNARGNINAFSSTFFLTLANPMAILVFTALFTATGVHGWNGDYHATATLVTGVLAGSISWAPVMIALVSCFQVRFTPSQIRRLNQLSGGLISLGGLALTVRALW